MTDQLSELELMRVKSAHSAGFMAGLEAAKKDMVSGLTGKALRPKMYMTCPVCKVESPMQDPDGEITAQRDELLVALKDARWRIANLVGPDGAQGLDRTALGKIDAAIAKATGQSLSHL
ncbi:hypothetical protein UFOVP33_46 [uncultured Caudovirales phage]|uniref:Uncharacterized protein n=1 Tax=uncultured Caudovirales phage TaxID=2100421 RepID=A0A6J5KN06_9CAUD|nr:hypothetical protein UFOVP33_46 [uncultured Caudovirales phage]